MNTRARAETWIAWALLLGFETVCQISLKTAGLANAGFDFSPRAFIAAISTPALWVAIGCYIGAFLAWMTILRKSTLSAAFATSAIVFVAVMLASWWVFGEHIGVLQLLGSAVIVAGILMLGTDDANPHTS
jgi:drug/metabolite transporter (DMT)-like permease